MSDKAVISENYVMELTKAQFELRVYIVSLLGNTKDAMDVLQETNLELWRKAALYDPSRPFIAWAKGLARYQVLAWRKRQQREKLLFSDGLVESLSQTLIAGDGDAGRVNTLDRLEGCLGKLNAFQRRYLEARYAERLGIPQIARKFHQTEPAVVSLLYRLRNLLFDCMMRPDSTEFSWGDEKGVTS